MRLVACVTGEPAGMFGRDDLRKRLRLGGVLLMAAAAEGGDFRQRRLKTNGIVGVLRLRSVTRLAGDVGVFAGGTDLSLVVMAEDAGSLAGKGGLALADQGERGGAIVAVLAEGFRNYGAPNNQKNSQPGEQNGRRADEMAGIPKEPHRRLAATEEARTRPRRLRVLIPVMSTA